LSAKDKPTVYIISDSIGETAEFVVNAVASQFNSGQVEIHRESFLTDAEHLKELIREAAGRKSMIAYTLVLPGLREVAAAEAKKYGLPTVDVLGPMLEAFSKIVFDVSNKAVEEVAGKILNIIKESESNEQY